MALSTVVISTVTPRGGPLATQVTLVGSGFGSVQGQVIFDPLGEAVQATVVSWVPNQIVYEAPALSVVNRTVMVQVALSGGSDGTTHPYWYPVDPLPPSIDYQWPSAEAGTPDQDVDNPYTFTAADFNRLRDNVTGGGGGLPPLAGEQYAALMEDPVGTLVFQRITQAMIAADFSCALSGGGTVEVGDTVFNPQFNASYVRTSVEALLQDSEGGLSLDVTLSPNPLTYPGTYIFSPLNYLVTFTLSAREEAGDPFSTAIARWYWRPRAFWGVGPSGQTSEAFIEALANDALASSRNRTFTVTPSGSEKIYYAYPASYGLATFSVGGFVGGFTGPIVVSVTNPFGVTMNYNLYESALTGLGTTTVEVA